MAKYLFVYHGGGMPDTPEQQAEEMAAWGKWFETMVPAIVDGGNPVGPSTTVFARRVEENGGANPASGYSLIAAASLEEAIAHAKGCPVLKGGGSVEVAETFDP
ncbi:MAG: hypothetical protein AAGA24_04200 [Pseudomonadota bacterium]